MRSQTVQQRILSVSAPWHSCTRHMGIFTAVLGEYGLVVAASTVLIVTRENIETEENKNLAQGIHKICQTHIKYFWYKILTVSNNIANSTIKYIRVEHQVRTNWREIIQNV